MRRLGLALLPAMLIAAGLWLSSTADASGIVYWGNYDGSAIWHYSLNGGGGGQVSTGSAQLEEPMGVAIDPVIGWIFWTDGGYSLADAFAWADLNDSGGAAEITVSGAGSVDEPWGMTADPAARKLYWANYANDTIASSNLDGGDSADLSTPGVTADEPDGVAVDPALGKIFWTNAGNPDIDWAYLNGTGGGTLDTGLAPIDRPSGLAIDPKNNRVYWTNWGGNSGTTIGWANLNGSGGGTLDTSGATVAGPLGVAIDPAGGRVYWANLNGGNPASQISSASVNGGDGSNLSAPDTGGAIFPSLLFPPGVTHRPKLSGGKRTGTRLRCTRGSWAGDIVESFFYQSAQSYSYSWMRNGHRIKNATRNSYKARKRGFYNCVVTAANAAGSTQAISKPHTVKRRHRS